MLHGATAREIPELMKATLAYFSKAEEEEEGERAGARARKGERS